MPPRRTNLPRYRRTPYLTSAQRRDRRRSQILNHTMRADVELLRRRLEERDMRLDGTMRRLNDRYGIGGFSTPSDNSDEEYEDNLAHDRLIRYYTDRDYDAYGFFHPEYRGGPRTFRASTELYEYMMNRAGAARGRARYRESRAAALAPVVIAAAVEAERPPRVNRRRQREEQLMLEWEAERPPHPIPYLGDDRGPPAVIEVPPVLPQFGPAPLDIHADHFPPEFVTRMEELGPLFLAYARGGNFNAFRVLANNNGIMDHQALWDMIVAGEAATHPDDLPPNFPDAPGSSF